MIQRRGQKPFVNRYYNFVLNTSLESKVLTYVLFRMLGKTKALKKLFQEVSTFSVNTSTFLGMHKIQKNFNRNNFELNKDEE